MGRVELNTFEYTTAFLRTYSFYAWQIDGLKSAPLQQIGEAKWPFCRGFIPSFLHYVAIGNIATCTCPSKFTHQFFRLLSGDWLKSGTVTVSEVSAHTAWWRIQNTNNQPPITFTSLQSRNYLFKTKICSVPCQNTPMNIFILPYSCRY